MHRVLSFYDVEQFPEAVEILINGEEKEVLNFFFSLGFDINRDIEQQYVNHRPMTTKEVWLTYRWIGDERKDEEWINSGYCTKENKLEITGMKDPHLLRDLVQMSRRPNFISMIMEYMQGDDISPKVKFVMEEVDE